jgi:hypothetical protein
MLGAFGGWQQGPRSGWRSRACGGPALALLLLACAGETLIVGEERPGLALEGASPASPGAAGDAGPIAIVPIPDCPPSPVQRQARLGCWPTRHLGRWHGFFIGAPRYETQDGESAEFPSGGLTLTVAMDGTAELSFGTAAADEREPCVDTRSLRCASVGRVLPGFAYRLEQMALFEPTDEGPTRVVGEPPPRVAERMEFSISLGQPWDGWCAEPPAASSTCGSEGACAKRSAACRCGETGCRPNAASLSMELRMSEDGNALRGVSAPTSGAVNPARLEFTREPEP